MIMSKPPHTDHPYYTALTCHSNSFYSVDHGSGDLGLSSSSVINMLYNLISIIQLLNLLVCKMLTVVPLTGFLVHSSPSINIKRITQHQQD